MEKSIILRNLVIAVNMWAINMGLDRRTDDTYAVKMYRQAAANAGATKQELENAIKEGLKFL